MTINSRSKGADRLEGGFIIPLDRHGLSEAAKHYLKHGVTFEPMPTDHENLSKKVRLAGDLLQVLENDSDNS
ncbi:MAG: hypothetical protein WCP01_10200 [Methylococcaceae bacterium]